MTGNLLDGTFEVEHDAFVGLEHMEKDFASVGASPELMHHFSSMAAQVQSDLETVVKDFVAGLRKLSGEQNLVFAGGVALNSTLNGILTTEAGFDKVHVPPYPGDEGIAIGSAMFGANQLLRHLHDVQGAEAGKPISNVMPYLGKAYSEDDILSAIRTVDPWISWAHTDVAEVAADALRQSMVVAWFQGRSEFGPRALGNRSILGDPRQAGMIAHINGVVKKREAFRPFAPSVLGESATEWFSDCDLDSSPFMSLTAVARRPCATRAVVHVNDTARLQTLRQDQNPTYHRLISLFQEKTGVPMVLNTSFNTAGEPVVESPADALACFLHTDGIDMLAFPPNIVVKRRYIARPLQLDSYLSSAVDSFRSQQTQDECGGCLGTVVTFSRYLEDDGIAGSASAENDASTADSSRMSSAELTDSLELELFEYIHSQKHCQVHELLACFAQEEIQEDLEESATGESIPVTADVLERLSHLADIRLVLVSESGSN